MGGLQIKMISYSLIGLSIIIISWVVLFFLIKKSKRISPIFIIIYSLGVLVLVYDGFNSGLRSLAIANLISFIVSVLVLIKVLKK
jgi:membrane-bound ClpP family serine protease